MAFAEADVRPVPMVTIVKPMGSNAAGAMAYPAIAVSTTKPAQEMNKCHVVCLFKQHS